MRHTSVCIARSLRAHLAVSEKDSLVTDCSWNYWKAGEFCKKIRMDTDAPLQPMRGLCGAHRQDWTGRTMQTHAHTHRSMGPRTAAETHRGNSARLAPRGQQGRSNQRQPYAHGQGDSQGNRRMALLSTALHHSYCSPEEKGSDWQCKRWYPKTDTQFALPRPWQKQVPN